MTRHGLAGSVRALLTSQTARPGALGAGLVVALLLLGKAIAFLREVVVARLFGVSPLVDAYVVGLNAVWLTVWLGAALQFAVVPFFVEAREHHPAERAGRVLSSVLWIGAGAGLLLSAVVFLGARYWVGIVGPGLAPETALRAASMMRALSPIGLASVVAAAAAGFQNANRRFVVARLYEPTVALVSLVSLVLIGASDGVAALAGGQTLGYVMAAGVLLVSVSRRFSPALVLPFRPILGRLFSLGWPTMATLLLFRLNSAVNKAFVSKLPEGSVAALGYAERLYLLPVTLLLATVVTFHYTHAAELALRGDTGELARQTGRNVVKVIALTIPVTVLIVLYARPVVRLTFERGAFDPAATAVTASVLVVYCLALLPHIVMELLTATMRGLGSMKTPMLAGLATLGVNALLCGLLVHRMGAPGAAVALAGGYAAGALIMTVLTIARLRRARDGEMVGG